MRKKWVKTSDGYNMAVYESDYEYPRRKQVNNESGPTLSDLLRNPHGTVGKVGEPVSWPAESGGVSAEDAMESAQFILKGTFMIIGDPRIGEELSRVISYLLGFDIGEEQI